MERILNLVFTADNVRMLVMLAFVCCGYVLISKQIDDLRHNDLAVIHKRIDNVEAAIKELKSNDLAHLNNTIEALTFTLEKNGFLNREDKDYINSRLAH